MHVIYKDMQLSLFAPLRTTSRMQCLKEHGGNATSCY